MSNSRIDFISGDVAYLLPTALPNVLPYDPITSKLRTNYFLFSVSWPNLHLRIEADAGWDQPMVSAIVQLWGFCTPPSTGIPNSPSLIRSVSITELAGVDVEIPNCIGYSHLYLRNLSETAVKGMIINEGKLSSGKSSNVWS